MRYTTIFTLLLIGLFTVPSFVFVFLDQSSLTAGLVLYALFLIAIYSLRKRHTLTKTQVVLLCLAMLSIVASNVILKTGDLSRQAWSWVALAVIFVGTNHLFRSIEHRGGIKIRTIIKIVFHALLVIGLIGKMRLLDIGMYSTASKPIFPFSEESHYALTIGPIACVYMMQIAPRFRILIPVILLGMGLWYPNLTLLLEATFLFALLINLRTFVVVIVVMLGIYASAEWLAELEGVKYAKSRIFASDEKENLTKLVYLQGWEQARIATRESHGLGIGFQSFGKESSGDYSIRVQNFHGSELNRKDGSTLGAKLVGEFGVIGAVLVIGAVMLSAYAFIRLRRTVRIRAVSTSDHDYIYLSIAYMFMIEMVFRGFSYFNPMILLYLYGIGRLAAATTLMPALTWRHNLHKEAL